MKGNSLAALHVPVLLLELVAGHLNLLLVEHPPRLLLLLLEPFLLRRPPVHLHVRVLALHLLRHSLFVTSHFVVVLKSIVSFKTHS